MNEVTGLIYELRLKSAQYLAQFESVDSEHWKRFTELNSMEFVEHDTYSFLCRLMKAGIEEFYIFTEAGKRKQPKAERIFGVVDYTGSNVFA